jgi:hypothetical protein
MMTAVIRGSVAWLAGTLFLLGVGMPGVPAQESASVVAEARKAAEAWLKLLDRGQYAKSWDEAASPFRDAMGRDAWAGTVQKVRAPFGQLKSRKLRGAQYATSLPNAPPGQYVVIQYDASFEHQPAVVETITPMLDTDGKWRVSGYYVR